MQLRAFLLVTLATSVAHADEPADSDVSADVLYYSDTDHVLVVTPEVSGRLELGDSGEVDVGVTVDVLTAASVDVVSHATNGFSETRIAGHLGGSLDLLGMRLGADLDVSHEEDYLSRNLGLSGQRELAGPDAILAGRLDLTYDTIGRNGTPSDVFSEDLWSFAAQASFSQNLSPRSVLRLTLDERVQSGYLEKPYRYVPLFDAEGLAAADAAGGLSLENFDRFRLPERPAENVPDLRWRQALAARLVHWLPTPGIAFRADYRFYADSWALFAHTLELGATWPITPAWSVGLSERLHRQDAASFYEGAYRVTAGTLPRWRTMDRELAPQLGSTTWVSGAYRRGRWRGYLELGWLWQQYSDYFLLEDRGALMVISGVSFTP